MAGSSVSARAAGSGPRGSRSKTLFGGVGGGKSGPEGVRRGLGIPRTGVARAGRGVRGCRSKTPVVEGGKNATAAVPSTFNNNYCYKAQRPRQASTLLESCLLQGNYN